MLGASRRFFQRTLPQALKQFKASGAHPDFLASVDHAKSAENGRSLVALESFLAQWQSGPRGQQPSGEKVDVRFWLGDPLAPISERFSSDENDASVKQRLVRLFGFSDFSMPPVDGSVAVFSLRNAVDSAQKARDMFANMVPMLDVALQTLRRYGVMLCVQGLDGMVMGLSEPELDPTRTFYRDRGMAKFMSEGVPPESLKHIFEIVRKIEKTYAMLRGQSVRTGVTIVLSQKAVEHFIAADGCIVLSLVGNAMSRYESFLLSLSSTQWTTCQDMAKRYRFEDSPAVNQWKKQGKHLAGLFNVHAFRAALRPTTPPSAVEDFMNRMLAGEGIIKGAMSKYIELRNPKYLESVGIWMEYDIRGGSDYMVSSRGEILVGSHVTVTQLLKVLRDHGKTAVLRHETNMEVDAAKRMLCGVLPNVRFEIDPALIDPANRMLRFMKVMATAGESVKMTLRAGSWIVVVSDRFEVRASGHIIYLPWDVTADKLSVMLLAKPVSYS